MNDKNKEAFECWLENNTTTQEEIEAYEAMSEKDRVMFCMKYTWQAACEYKQKEIDDILGQLKSCIFVYEEKVNRLIAENEKLRDNILLLQEKTLVLGELEAENKKLRECVEYYADLDDECIGYDIRGVTTAREALKDDEGA